MSDKFNFYKEHRKQHPNCTYGDQPHFVPPSFGQIGCYMCDPPADLRNHLHCRPPYDHAHIEHYHPDWNRDRDV